MIRSIAIVVCCLSAVVSILAMVAILFWQPREILLASDIASIVLQLLSGIVPLIVLLNGYLATRARRISLILLGLVLVLNLIQISLEYSWGLEWVSIVGILFVNVFPTTVALFYLRETRPRIESESGH